MCVCVCVLGWRGRLSCRRHRTSLTPRPPGLAFPQLRVGDFADYCGQDTQFVWVTVSVLEVGPFDTELHLSVQLTGATFWVSVEAPDQRWAVCGHKATGELPPGSGDARLSGAAPAPDASALRALEDAAIVRMLRGPHVDFRRSLEPGVLVDARHAVEGLWYQVCSASAWEVPSTLFERRCVLPAQAMVVETRPADETSQSTLQCALLTLGVDAAAATAFVPLADYVKVRSIVLHALC